MDPGIHQKLAGVEAAVGDLHQIVQRLVELAEIGVVRGMAHTEGVDALIGIVDKIERVSALAEESGGNPLEPEEAPPKLLRSSQGVGPMRGDLSGLCDQVRHKAADLDRLNREGVNAFSEVNAQADAIVGIERTLREGLASVREAVTDVCDKKG